MPHLQVETTADPDAAATERVVDRLTALFAEAMGTGTGHVAVTVRTYDDGALALGRADDGAPVAVLNADVRAGRSAEQRRRLASGSIDLFASVLGVDPAHAYVVYTEHDGADFHLAEGPLESWSGTEADEGALD